MAANLVELRCGLGDATSCSANRFRTPEKRRSRLNVSRTRRGVVSFAWRPHPHALSQAFASFFLSHAGVLHTVFSANGPHRLGESS